VNPEPAAKQLTILCEINLGFTFQRFHSSVHSVRYVRQITPWTNTAQHNTRVVIIF